MERRKLTKQDIDKVRHIEGFPIAKDEDIIALSDPPYYTACPNPFIEDFIKEHGKPYDEATDDYHREPFAADVSEGKNDPIYNAHSYHTKVPHKAIMRYILHYTEPGDIVLDGFCGTGMTGVAAQMCGSPDAEFKHKIEHEMPYVTWGARKAILSDLSPAATFIAYNYNTPVDVQAFEKEAKRILKECEAKLGWMYETQHVVDGKVQRDILGNPIMGRINYTVWSDVFICPTCSSEIVFWESAYNKNSKCVEKNFTCSKCNSRLKKEDCNRADDHYFDSILAEVRTVNKQIPVAISYSVNKKRYEKTVDKVDLANIDKISNIMGTLEINSFPMLHRGGSNWGEIWRAGYHRGLTHSHHFYTNRNLIVVDALWSRAHNPKLKWAITSILNYVNKRQSFTGGGGGMPGVLYIASLLQEKNVFDVIKRKLESLVKLFSTFQTLINTTAISTGSSTMLFGLESNCIDYIFVDPPFGGNIMYSEASFLWECLLQVFTNDTLEAIESKYQGKSLPDYLLIIKACFYEFFRVLKPDRWITVEFHNSQNNVWNAIQEAITSVGFIIADVSTLDKKQGSFKQVTSTGAVKQDLVISAYKPKENFVRDFVQKAGNPEAAFDFVRQHLEKLPVVVIKNGRIEIINERQAYLLFDRMVAYHIVNGLSVPLDAPAFYQGLNERFMQRDGMYFLPSQVNEYDTARIINDVEPVQMELLVTNERSAIAWLYQQLDIPQTYGELQPKFMQEQRAIARFEALPELQVLLEENFLQDDKGRWYIPDVTKEGDLAKLRNKNLLKEFEGYLATKGKLKLFRLEAIRAGFAKLWDERNYRLIIDTAERLPESVVQEDDKLLMYYDISLGRV